MSCPDITDSPKIVEMIFIAALPFRLVKESIQSLLKFENIQLKPEILFSYPDSRAQLDNSKILDVCKNFIHKVIIFNQSYITHFIKNL
jgi:hypothetical protein